MLHLVLYYNNNDIYNIDWIIMGGIIYNIVHNVESSINDSIQFNLDQVSIQLITSQGINIHILGSIDINYNDIINLIQRNSIKLLLGYLVV